MATFATDEQPPVPQGFFTGPVTEVARALLGHILVHETQEGTTAGIIVETEAYDATDPASHSFNGRTERNAPMFEQGGTVYVYRSYGIHWCLNVVTGPEGTGAAVLLRALQPVTGLDLMARRRNLPATGPVDPMRLCSGPGKLTQAMGVTGGNNRQKFRQGPLRLLHGPQRPIPQAIVAAPRIGISKAKDAPWRFCIQGNKFVSLPRPKQT